MIPRTQERLIKIVEKDLRMLQEIGTMDYSLLLFIHEEPVPSITKRLSKLLVNDGDEAQPNL